MIGYDRGLTGSAMATGRRPSPAVGGSPGVNGCRNPRIDGAATLVAFGGRAGADVAGGPNASLPSSIN